MAAKRLAKELRDWQEMTNPHFVRWAEERESWTVRPDTEDILTWTAALRPKKGAFEGGHLTWKVSFPRDYPFKPPGVKRCLSLGREITLEDASPGMHVTLSPVEYETERFTGLITDASLERGYITVVWNDAEHGGPGPQFNMPKEQEVSRDWWDSGAHPASAGATLFHPNFSDTGECCLCGIERSWSPALVFPSVLAYLRVAIEDPDLTAENRAVPAGSGNLMCYCCLNARADVVFKQDPGKALEVARDKFLGSHSVVPLQLSAISQAYGFLAIECTAFSGEVLATFDMVPDQTTLASLRMLVQERIALPEGSFAWKLVLPDGTVPDECKLGVALADLLGI